MRVRETEKRRSASTYRRGYLETAQLVPLNFEEDTSTPGEFASSLNKKIRDELLFNFDALLADVLVLAALASHKHKVKPDFVY